MFWGTMIALVVNFFRLNQPKEMEERREDWASVAAAMRERRRFLDDLSQQDAAELAGIGVQTWRNIESGKAANYRSGILDKIEDTLQWPRGIIDMLARGEVSNTSNIEFEGRFALVEKRVADVSRQISRVTHHLAAFAEIENEVDRDS